MAEYSVTLLLFSFFTEKKKPLTIDRTHNQLLSQSTAPQYVTETTENLCSPKNKSIAAIKRKNCLLFISAPLDI